MTVDAQVQPGTLFAFRQTGDELEGLYYGGRVQFGLITGKINGDRITWRYKQVADDGQTYLGESNVVMYRLSDGRICLKDEWKWSDGRGTGSCVMVERR
jgi:hypothetical protein